MSLTPGLKELVDQWLRQDPNEETRKEVETLLKEGQYSELEKRMSPRIEFGTAGLRGRMEAGWARMNDLIIIQASQGLCAYVVKTVENARERGIVIGYDHRYHSEKWAKLTAAVFIENGVAVYFHDGVVHTPLVPFNVRAKRAACGVMITASHNPKQDNGYKVYWENAVQIIEPHDKGISQSIKEHQEPRLLNIESLHTSTLLKQYGYDEYLAYIGSLCHSRTANTQTPLKFVNTSMHGVSDSPMSKAFELFGFPMYVPVAAQQKPDPEFPTVKFPNPEEKGALDLAMATATECGADYILAQDPDSDRFAAAERGPDGKWIQFTGDQLGTLFASACLEQYKETGKPLSKLAMVASTVSSKMIEAMAHAEGFKFAECLTGVVPSPRVRTVPSSQSTGFKYIGNTGLTLEQEGYTVPFGYEEAIGFMFGDQLRDKDGVAASVRTPPSHPLPARPNSPSPAPIAQVAFGELVVRLQQQGKTASSHLRELSERYGFFQQLVLHLHGPVHDRAHLRAHPRLPASASAPPALPAYPPTLAGLAVTAVRDLTEGHGYESANAPSCAPTLPLSSGQMIQFRAERRADGVRVTLTTRTSGTEPKIKYYLEGSGKDPAAVAALLPMVVRELSEVWMEAEKNGLGKP
ncbi:phosphoglucomutase 1 [Epithele typhae]|uniref:phosphoglucomutase 1 n=1 Tax=Epithele typhae TaxID=378194 RepID=UPI002007B020|nr:phosphoglucomutase 1 [Epithele typhae]KAH9946369.1 phosphoglucomutase 1 [Epithele typhae]